MIYTSYNSTKGNLGALFSKALGQFNTDASNPYISDSKLARQQAFLNHLFNAIGGQQKVKATDATSGQKHIEETRQFDRIAIDVA